MAGRGHGGDGAVCRGKEAESDGEPLIRVKLDTQIGLRGSSRRRRAARGVDGGHGGCRSHREAADTELSRGSGQLSHEGRKGGLGGVQGTADAASTAVAAVDTVWHSVKLKVKECGDEGARDGVNGHVARRIVAGGGQQLRNAGRIIQAGLVAAVELDINAVVARVCLEGLVRVLVAYLFPYEAAYAR